MASLSHDQGWVVDHQMGCLGFSGFGPQILRRVVDSPASAAREVSAELARAHVGLWRRRGVNVELAFDATERGHTEVHADSAVVRVLGIEPPSLHAVATTSADLGHREATPLAEPSAARQSEPSIFVGSEQPRIDGDALAKHQRFTCILGVRGTTEFAGTLPVGAAGLEEGAALHLAGARDATGCLPTATVIAGLLGTAHRDA